MTAILLTPAPCGGSTGTRSWVIVAPALLESLTVVTSDAALAEFPAIRTLW